jgi:hypothetical protein
MTIDYENRARIHIECEAELHERFTMAVPHGIRSTILRALILQLTEAIEREGFVVAALILDNKLTLFGRNN